MKNSIYIQEIERLNSKISIYKLIDKHFKLRWWIVIALPIVLFILSYTFFLYRSYWFLGISILSAIISLFCIIHYIDRKRKIIIQQKYPYALQNEKALYNRMFPEIQKQELKKLLGSNIVLTKENLPFIIECLKSRKGQNKYGYNITFNAVVLFVSLFLVLLSRYLEFIQPFEEFRKVGKIIMGISLLILVTIIYIDITFRDIILNKRQNQSRIIRTLENIYLDISTDK